MHYASKVKIFLLLLTILAAPALSQIVKEAERGKVPWDEMLSKAKQIEQELGTDKVPEWAGRYHWGSLGFSGSTLTLAPKTGFVYRPYTDYTPNDIMDKFDYGTVEVMDSRIFLRSTRQHFGDERFYFVKWDERSLLIPEAYFPLLLNFFNAGCADAKEYSDVGHMYFPTKADQVRKKLSGRPVIPAAFNPLLLRSPLTAKITSIVGKRVKKQFLDTETHLWYDQYTTVALNIGSHSGVWTGMNLYARISEGATEYYRLQITKTSETTSEGEVYRSFEGTEPAPPQRGFVFSSRLDQDLLDYRIRPWACI